MPGCPCRRPLTVSSVAAALQIRCPACKERKGHYCRSPNGRRTECHLRRVHKRFTEAGIVEAVQKGKVEQAPAAAPPPAPAPTTLEFVEVRPAAPAPKHARLQDPAIFAALVPKEPI